jgi:hypothetical protein
MSPTGSSDNAEQSFGRWSPSDSGFVCPQCSAVVRDRELHVRWHNRHGPRQIEVVTREGQGWVEANYPGWRIIDSDDGMTVEGGTSYLLERSPVDPFALEDDCDADD